jgi:hypothetical protein
MSTGQSSSTPSKAGSFFLSVSILSDPGFFSTSNRLTAHFTSIRAQPTQQTQLLSEQNHFPVNCEIEYKSTQIQWQWLEKPVSTSQTLMARTHGNEYSLRCKPSAVENSKDQREAAEQRT